MSLRKSQENEVLDKEIHCPYCETDHAVLLTKITAKKISIQYPAFGLKFLLSLLYLSVVQIMIYGYKLIEAVKKIDSVTYALSELWKQLFYGTAGSNSRGNKGTTILQNKRRKSHYGNV